MKIHWLLMAATAASVSGCYNVESPAASRVGSFQVDVQTISAVASNGSLQPLSVVPSCIKQHGTRLDQVPAEVRGTKDCPYVVPNGQVELRVDILALDTSGKTFDFNGPVSFKVVPGDLSGDYTYYWTNLSRGRGVGTLRAAHVYGEVRVWALDEPVQPNYSDGGIDGDPTKLPTEPSSRTFAAGSSETIYFQEPSLATIQTPQIYDNRDSPFMGQFVTIGRAPESGSIQYQNCPDRDLDGDGKVDPEPPKPVTLLVTGTDPSGFFVTDITSCPVPEDTSSAAQVNVPEPSGYLPGSYGSMFVYNYNFPEGLNAGDLLWTLSGSVQEFTATTQLTFPSWTVREHVRELPPDQWNKYLALNPPVELNLRHCGLKNQLSPQGVDILCGYYNSNLKLESLESGLVKLRRARFPKVFKNCDLNGDGDVPFFCNSSGAWVPCGTPPEQERAEIQCNIDCTTGAGEHLNTVCSELTQFNGFGQFVVEMAGPGPRAAGLDDTLSSRWQEVLLSNTASDKTPTAYEDGTEVSVWCDLDTHFRFGTATVTAANTDELLPAKTRKDVIIEKGQGFVAFLAPQLPPTSPSAPAPRCYVSRNTHSRVLVMTKDAVPDLKVDCNENDANAERARQCRYLHGATYDVVGHLKQIQAARPRWMVLPRDADDICCYPGPDMQCPSPIQTCK